MKNYKIFLIIFFALFIKFGSKAQNFEGKLIYSQLYESKNPDIPTDVLAGYMGDRHIYFYSKGNYMSVVNGNREKTTLYLVDDEKLYSYSENQDSISVIDTSEENEKVLRYELNEKVAQVLGRSCDELILYKEKSTVKYYFDPNLKIEPKHFKNHNYSNWNLYTKLAKSLPLKYIMEFDEFVVIGEAIEIKEFEIEDDFFVLPR